MNKNCSRCGKDGHYSMTSYFNCLKPNWKDKHLEPWIRKEIYHGKGSYSYIDVCKYCGTTPHQSACRMNKGYPFWYQDDDGGGRPSGGGFYNPFSTSQIGQPSQEYWEQQQKLEKERLELEKQRQKEEKANIEKMRAIIDKWEAEWKEYILSGGGVELTFVFNNPQTTTKERITWIRPRVFNVKIASLEGMDENIKKLGLVDVSYTYTPSGETTAKKVQIDYIFVDKRFTCLPNALDDEEEYHTLMAENVGFGSFVFKQDLIQLFLSKDTLIDVKNDGSQNYFDLRNSFFHLRKYEKIINLDWNNYWKNRQVELKKIKLYNLALKKIERIKKEIILKVEDGDEQNIRKEQILKEIGFLLDPSKDERMKQGYFDDVYDIKAFEDRKSLTKLVIDLTSFTNFANKTLNLSKFKLISKGTIALNDFPSLKQLIITGLDYFDSEANFSFQTLDLTKTAPDLEELKCDNSRNLIKVMIGKKTKLKHLDFRYTALTDLDLSNTNFVKTDYGSNKFPTRNDEDELVKPFTLDGDLTIGKIQWKK